MTAADAVERVRLVVAYRGTRFHGSSESPGVRTVMGVLRTEIERVVRRPVRLTAAGRTDAGVHAWGQVVSVDLPQGTDLDGLGKRLNKLCAPDISVRSVERVDDDFDARFSATWRRYRYHLWNDPSPNPLLDGLVWHVAEPLDLAAMSVAARDLVGEHDFSSFCRAPKTAPDGTSPSLTRIVHDTSCVRIGDTALVRFEVRGSAFCHQQVRSMVGTLVDVGRRRRPPDCIPAVLAARSRAVAARVAPPDGLALWAVGYDGSRWDS